MVVIVLQLPSDHGCPGPTGAAFQSGLDPAQSANGTGVNGYGLFWLGIWGPEVRMGRRGAPTDPPSMSAPVVNTVVLAMFVELTDGAV